LKFFVSFPFEKSIFTVGCLVAPKSVKIFQTAKRCKYLFDKALLIFRKIICGFKENQFVYIRRTISKEKNKFVCKYDKNHIAR
jgi:hypothetical protein